MGQPADQKAEDSPTAVTAVPGAQTSGLSLPKPAKDNWDLNGNGAIDPAELERFFEPDTAFAAHDDDDSGKIEPAEFSRELFARWSEGATSEMRGHTWSAPSQVQSPPLGDGAGSGAEGGGGQSTSRAEGPCADLAALQRRTEQTEPAELVGGEVTLRKVRRLLRNAQAFCEDGRPDLAAELTDNVRTLLRGG